MKKKGQLRKLGRLAFGKKGSEAAETTEVNLGQLLISILQILIFVALVVGIYSLTRKSFADQGTEESYYDLVAKLQALEKDEFPEGIGHAYYIKKGFYLYGFNSNAEDIGIDGDRVRKPKACERQKSCICLCNDKGCSDYVSCNTRLLGEKHVPVSFANIEYFYVTGDPKNKLNKGKEFSIAGAGSVKYLAIPGDGWRAGKLLYLTKRGNAVQFAFQAPSEFGGGESGGAGGSRSY